MKDVSETCPECHSIVILKCITDHCNEDLRVARDIVPQTKLHVFNLSHLTESYVPVLTSSGMVGNALVFC